MLTVMIDGQLLDLSDLTGLQFRELCRRSFPLFFQKCFHSLAPTATLHLNWHIEAIAYHLELLHKGNITRLMVNLPPRSLKPHVFYRPSSLAMIRPSE